MRSSMRLARTSVLVAALLPLAFACQRSITNVRLVGGATPREGRLQVRVACANPDGTTPPPTKGSWVGRFCQTQVDIEDYEIGVDSSALPQVVCRQLGFTGGIQQFFEAVPPLNTTELAGNLICRDNEASVRGCEFNSGHLEKAGWCKKIFDESMEDRGGLPYEVGVVCNGAAPRFDNVALAGGPTPREGRLLVHTGGKNGSWGRVCASGYRGDPAAIALVACRQLGLGEHGAARPSAFYGRGKARIAARVYSCTGSERRLDECVASATVPEGDCQGDDDGFGVWCGGAPYVQSVRLVGGFTKRDGRVEVQLEGRSRWGSSAVRYYWASGLQAAAADKVAAAACRQLGFASGVAQGDVAAGTPAVLLLDQVECPAGMERSLSACSFVKGGGGEPNDYWKPLAVACSGHEQPLVRLAGGSTPREGRVEVLSNGAWRPIADTVIQVSCSTGGTCTEGDPSFGLASVVCRQLGYGGAGGPRHGYGWAAPAPNITAVASAACTGLEPGLLSCYLSPSGETDPRRYIGVSCAGAPKTISHVRLVGGASPKEGQLEARVMGGAWGTVGVGGDWRNWREPAHAACRHLGYSTGYPRFNSFYPAPKLPRVLDDLYCTGQEGSLEECSFSAPPSQWEEWRSLNVACTGSRTIRSVRLVNGTITNPSSGRLEVRVAGQGWSTVGGLAGNPDDEYVPSPAAGVACRQLGFPASDANWKFSKTRSGASNYAPDIRTPQLLSSIHCDGTEDSLSQCMLWRQDAGSVCAGPRPPPEECWYVVLTCSN